MHISDKALIQFFRKHFVDVIELAHEFDFEKMSELCEREFGITLHSEYSYKTNNPEDYFILKPKLVCLNPFSLIYSSSDDFSPVIGPEGNYVLYLDQHVRLLENKNDLFYEAKSIYGEEFKVGLKTLALTKENFFPGVKNLKIILVRTSEQSDKKIVHHLI